MKANSKVVFLDRDGTILKLVPYLSRLEDYEIYPNASVAIKRLNECGYKVIVVTNQSGLARGLFGEEELKEINEKMCNDLIDKRAKIDSVYFCPHHPSDNCKCRKPRSGMLRQADSEIGIDFSISYVVGDSMADLIAGLNLGCKTILVRTGYGDEEEARLSTWNFKPDYVANDLEDASRWITK